MSLISLQDVAVGYGGPPLLVDANLQIERGERICLLGRNGVGKSTLLRLIEGLIHHESGEVVRQQNIIITSVPQQVPQGLDGTVFEQVAGGLGAKGQLLAEYHKVAHDLTNESSKTLLRRLDQLQQSLDIDGGWDSNREVETIITKMGLDPDANFAELSAGLKRRVLFSRSLAGRPDILLLDEPTNHLDISAIDWLEDFLPKFDGTLIFVTHDRMFLKKIATRIIEIDRTRLTSWSCNYETYLTRKQQVIDAQLRQNNLFDKKLAQEEVWIRKGVKARRVRNEGRVRALKEMRRERKERLQQVGTVKMQAQDAQRSGRIVIKVNSMNFGYVDDSYIIKDFSTIIERGDKIGFLGPNGIGKTTLMKLLLGRLQPQSGRIKHGTNLEIAYFDQLHSTLDEQKTVQENIIDGSDTLKINGRPRNIIGYLRDFLFTPAIARTPVWRISGGEKNRLLLAKMFAQPSNVLLLDEPTNDLDIETLDLLEDLLLDYSGTVLIITHDRAFLNNVVTSTFVFEGGGIVKEYAGGYDDWLCQRKPRQKDDNAGDNNLRKTAKKVRRQKTLTDKPPRLTYKEKLELEKLPRQIELLESRLSQMHEKMMEPEFYKGPGEIIAKLKAESQEIDEQLTAAYSRWEELVEIEN